MFESHSEKSPLIIEVKRANLTLRSYFSDYYELCSCCVAISIPNI